MKKEEKTIFLIISFLILFIIQFISLIGWTFLLLAIIEDSSFSFLPSGNFGIAIFYFINLLLTLIISGLGIFIYKKRVNKTIFWILYTIFTIVLFSITSYSFRELVI